MEKLEKELPCRAEGKNIMPLTRVLLDSRLESSLVAQLVNSLPARWETQVQSPGWEDPLEKKMANHSRILAWGIPWTEEPGGL